MLKTQYYEETISDVIARIDSNDIFLPALQRKFVWDTDQIEKLFDSIMQGFPIGTFLEGIFGIRFNIAINSSFFIFSSSFRDNISVFNFSCSWSCYYISFNKFLHRA